ncbi:heme lyase CcmF/NrfE family subunit [Denitratisoma sp. agr-D3]
MIPELGVLALILAFWTALAQGLLSLLGAQRRRDDWMALARPACAAHALLLVLAFACLAWAFVDDDFSVAYVARHSHEALPLPYKLGAVWGGHEGSLLLWVLELSLWSLALAWASRRPPRLPLPASARVLGVLGLLGAGFTAFILLTSNPFARLLPAADGGRDLNPLLQDPGLVFHPPMLYMGYVGFAVAYAFALAALLEDDPAADWSEWAHRSRPWTLAAWLFLTLGIGLGAWWAYNELGWGGWWFWDPVENASFMPWLAGAALLHSLAVTAKRGHFPRWSLFLAVVCFSLSLLGTFLVRSGILSSVHAFATDPKRGIFILAFLATVIGASAWLFLARQSRASGGKPFSPLSRETLLLGNNLLLLTACASVLLGTLYPLALDVLGLGKISVGPPYFNSVFVPLVIPVCLLLGPGLASRWGRDSAARLLRQLALPFGLCLPAALLLPLAWGHWSAGAALGLFAALWIAASHVQQIVAKLRSGRRPGRAWWGMVLAHLGFALCVAGITVVKTYETEEDVKLSPGQQVRVGGQALRFVGVTAVPGPNYQAQRGDLVLADGIRLAPEKRQYLTSAMPMTEAAIDSTPWRDIYISLGEALEDGAWTLRIYYKPLIGWLWAGALLMAAGALLAASSRIRRGGP